MFQKHLPRKKLRKKLSWNYNIEIKNNRRDNNVHMDHKNDKNRSKEEIEIGYQVINVNGVNQKIHT